MESTEAAVAVASGLAVFFMFAGGIVSILMLVSMWKVFTKAGQPGWGVIVPIYNIILMLKIAGKPGWWLLLFFVPVVNFVIAILMLVGISTNFGKGAGYAIGMLFLPIVFYPMLAFGSATYSPVEA